MNSFFSTLAESLLTELSLNMAMLERLHTVSIEFTVMRENSLPVGLEINLRYLLAEQKDTVYQKIAKDIVKQREKGIKRIPPLY